jgi:hypothetical protein
MKISRTQAWHDLKDDAARFMHTFTDVFVNLARIAGVKDRDRSQNIGRAFAILVVVIIIGTSIAGVTR